MPYKDRSSQERWRREHPTHARDFNLRRNYGITLADFERLATQQDSKCAICKRAPAGKHNQNVLHVDHDHNTGKVRGLLCSDCNRGIGFLGDDPNRVAVAATYLADRR